MNTTTAMIPVGHHQVPAPVFEAIRGQLVANLGDGEVFWITQAGEKKRGFKAKVKLDYGTHFCFPGSSSNTKAMITGEGFDYCNRFAGVEIFKPQKLMGPSGVEVGNPFFEKDEHGALVAVTMRGIGIGYSPTGNLVAVDQTVYLHMRTLLIQAIQAKIKRNPSLGMIGTKDERPDKVRFFKGAWNKQKKCMIYDEDPTEKPMSGFWHYVHFAEDMGYWVCLSHPEIQAAFDEFSQKQRFGERSTYTVLKRLILSAHPAIGCKTPIVTSISKTEGDYPKINGGSAHVFVYGFRLDQDGEQRRAEMASLAERVAEGERVANMNIVTPPAHDASSEEEVGQWEDADPSEIPSEDDDGPATVGTAAPPPPAPPAPPTPPAEAPAGGTQPAPTPTQAPAAAAKTAARPPLAEGTGYQDACAACNGTGKASNGNACVPCAGTGRPRKAPPAAAPTPAAGKSPAGRSAAASPAIVELNKILPTLTQEQQEKAVAIRNEMGFKEFRDLRGAGDERVAAFIANLRAQKVVA